MINILYAASDNINSKIQLSRFLENIDANKFNVKIAAYKKSSPSNLNIDWTLDCLYNMFTKRINLDNYYLDIYCKQIKNFSPDLVISDMEYFTTNIALSLNYEIWQCSSSLIDIGLSRFDKSNSNIFGNYAAVLNKTEYNYEKELYLTSNSNRNYVYSYFCDIENRPNLKENFKWIRPYFLLGEESSVCKHNVVATCLNNNIELIKFVSKYNDSILFGDNKINYNNIYFKYYDDNELACNIYNCNFFVCEGHPQQMTDAFYNNKKIVVIPNMFNNECLINSLLSKKYNLCDVIYSSNDNYNLIDYKINIDNNASFLHEQL